MQIVLLGARGSGKTTVGRAVANHFGCEFVDVDDVIVTRAGKTIAQIFADDGEPAFRDLESAVVEDVLRWTDDRVISLGGGSIVRESNRDLLARSSAYRYYLRATPEVLDERIRADPRTAANRPALTKYTAGVDEIRHLLAAREPLYRQVKTHEIDVTHLSPHQVAKMIIAEVQSDTGRCFFAGN